MNTPYIVSRSAWQAKVFWPPPYPDSIEAGPPPVVEDPTIEDSWPVENKNDDGSYGFRGTIDGQSMSFIAGRGGILDRCKVWMKQNHNPVGQPPDLPPDTPPDITAAIYDTTMPVESATPDGARLAISEPINVLDLQSSTEPPNIAPVEFFFTGANQIQLVKDKVYCLVFERPQVNLVWDSYRFGFDHSLREPWARGNFAERISDGSWAYSYPYFDMIFYVYSLP